MTMYANKFDFDLDAVPCWGKQIFLIWEERNISLFIAV
jgi:hypothetical protein